MARKCVLPRTIVEANAITRPFCTATWNPFGSVRWTWASARAMSATRVVGGETPCRRERSREEEMNTRAHPVMSSGRAWRNVARGAFFTRAAAVDGLAMSRNLTDAAAPHQNQESQLEN